MNRESESNGTWNTPPPKKKIEKKMESNKMNAYHALQAWFTWNWSFSKYDYLFVLVSTVMYLECGLAISSIPSSTPKIQVP